MRAPDPPLGSVASALLARHSASPQPLSRAVTAVLRSVLDVLAESGLEPTPATLFAACMASLERGEARADGEVRVVLRGRHIWGGEGAGGGLRGPRCEWPRVNVNHDTSY